LAQATIGRVGSSLVVADMEQSDGSAQFVLVGFDRLTRILNGTQCV